ncbi:MAG: rhodanese-like domain-containing protein [Thermomicrobiales bacterium]
MTPESTTTAAQLVAEAKSRTENLTPDDVAREMAEGSASLIDLREPEERAQNGTIPGAIHAPRGMLEFYADPTSSYHRPEFDPNRRTILHCASGGRSALAAGTLKQLGYRNVAHLEGGIKAWQETGHAVEDANASS